MVSNSIQSFQWGNGNCFNNKISGIFENINFPGGSAFNSVEANATIFMIGNSNSLIATNQFLGSNLNIIIVNTTLADLTTSSTVSSDDSLLVTSDSLLAGQFSKQLVRNITGEPRLLTIDGYALNVTDVNDLQQPLL
jgi:hypothetical protein